MVLNSLGSYGSAAVIHLLVKSPTIAGLSISHFNSVSFMQVEVLLLSEIMFTISVSLR